MKTRLILPLFALFLAVSASAATISGTLGPTGGLTVAAYDASGNLVTQTVADPSSRYTLTVNPGSYRLLGYDPAGVYATGFYPNADSFESSTVLNVSGNLTNIDFSLVKGGFIAGTVTAANGGAPLPGITVAVYNPIGTRRGFTHTDNSGHYLLVVPPGTYALAAYDDTLQYVTTFYNNQATFGNANFVGVTEALTSTANFSLAASVHITGTVIDAGGAPLANITVNAYDANGTISGTTTGANGQYSLSLRSGSYRIVFEDPAGVYAPVFYPDAESFSTSTPVNAPATNINASLRLGGKIAGSVTSSTGGALSNVVVAAYNADGTLRTTTVASSGLYQLLVPAGDYRIGAFDNSLTYAPQFFAQQPLFGGASVVHATAGATVPNISFTLHEGGRFSGMVTGLAGITVGAYSDSGTLFSSALTRTDGTYRMVVEPGTYKLVASDDTHTHATAYLNGAVNFETDPPVSVAASQEVANLNFTMALAANISGTVNDINSGAPVSGIIIDAYDSNGYRIARATTTSSGGFSLALPGGSYKFVASDPLHRYAASYYNNASGYETALALSLVGGQSTSITFRLSAAAPFAARRRAVRH